MILFPSPGDYQGGSVHSSLLLVEELVRRKRRVLLAFHGEGFARDLARHRGLPHIDLPAFGKQGDRDRFRMSALFAAPWCRRFIRDNGVSLVHVNDKQMLRTWSIPTRAAGAILVAHWRTTYSPSWSIDLALKAAARVICISSYNRDLLPPAAKAKSDIIYNPFRALVDRKDYADIRRRTRDTAGIPQDAAVIGIFGALLERKRPHVLLRLLQRLKTTADGRPVFGIVCGEILEPRDGRFFQMMQAEDWQGRVVFPGYVDKVGEWMAACDVMIAPAVDEAFGRVGIEAQSVGLPVVVSSDAGMREMVEDGISGLIVDPEDFEGWVAAVRRILDDRGFAGTLAEGGLRAAEALTVERHADAVEAVYDKLLARVGRS